MSLSDFLGQSSHLGGALPGPPPPIASKSLSERFSVLYFCLGRNFLIFLEHSGQLKPFHPSTNALLVKPNRNLEICPHFVGRELFQIEIIWEPNIVKFTFLLNIWYELTIYRIAKLCHTCVKAFVFQSPNNTSFGAQYKTQSSLSKIWLNKLLLGKPRYKKNGKKKVTLSPFGNPPS